MRALSILCVSLFLYSCSHRADDEIAIQKVVEKTRNLENSTAPQLVCKPMTVEGFFTTLRKGLEHDREVLPDWRQQVGGEWDPASSLHSTDKPVDPVCTLEGHGFTPGDSFRFYKVDLRGQIVSEDELQINRLGQPYLTNHRMMLDHLRLSHYGFMNGEYVAYVAVSKNPEKDTAVLVFPNPIAYRWTDGAFVNLWMSTPDAKEFVVSGSGFSSNERIKIYSDLSSLASPLAVIDACGGKFSYTVIPPGSLSEEGIPMQEGGSATLHIKRSSRDGGPQRVSLPYLWGSEAKKPSNRKPLRAGL